MASRELTLASGTRVAVNAPGFEIEAAAPVMAAAAAPVAEIPGDWLEAMAMNGVLPEHVEPLPMQIRAVPEAAPAAMLTRRGSPGPHVEIAAEPQEDFTALLMVQRGEVVQWFVPVNAPRVVPRHAGMRAAVVGVERQPLRFLVPASLLQPPTPPPGNVAAAAFFGRVVSKIVRIPLIRDLVDAPIRFLVEHIAKFVEGRNKDEGFKFFDDAGAFPPVSRQQLIDMADKPVLFLTHGVFSSIGGAFNDLLGTPALAALRGRYENRIIGWDHFTISKTPLENADDMLSAMAPAMNVDFVCHSRGALVMRAALEHDKLREKRRTRFRESGVGNALFVAGANQGSQLASFEHVNTLLNVYAAIGHVFPGLALDVIFAVLRILAHGVSTLPSVEALSSDASNTFVRDLNQQPRMSVRGKLAIAHANYDPRQGVLRELANLNIDTIFGTANDLVVPFAGAAQFDPNVIADEERAFGSARASQPDVFHTNFFAQPDIQGLIGKTLL